MNIWPAFSHTTLETCDNGAIVRVVVPRVPDSLAIMCKDRDGGKGLIFLNEKNLVFKPIENPRSIQIFRYDTDPVLLLDHASIVYSCDEEIRRQMGVVVFVKSGCYLNVHLDTSSFKRELRFSFKNKVVESVYETDEHDGMAYKNWRLVLVNPHDSNSEPVEIFSMQSS